MYERFLQIKELWIISLQALAITVIASYIILKITNTVVPEKDFFKTNKK